MIYTGKYTKTDSAVTGRKALLYFMMFGLLFLFFEGLALLASQFLDKKDFFDHRALTFEHLNETDMQAFRARSADPVLGWDHFGPQVIKGENCRGAAVDYTIDKHGARTYPGYDPDAVKILTVGDSFTNGAEASDADAYPAKLASMLDVSVANHGIGGYGPVQSVLNLEQKLKYYPQASVVVLGIMYENIYRMVNSYRDILYLNSFNYGIKPYMAGGKLRPYPGKDVLSDLDHFKQYASDAFDRDFWAKPVYGFPYSWSLIKSLSTHYFVYRRLQKNFRKAGFPEYILAYRSEDFLSELFPLLQRYTDFSVEHNLTPVVVFIPHNVHDTSSVTAMIERQRGRFPRGLLVGDMAGMDVDWENFNIRKPDKDDEYCHPSAYGYRKIADYTADLLRSEGIWPPGNSSGH